MDATRRFPQWNVMTTRTNEQCTIELQSMANELADVRRFCEEVMAAYWHEDGTRQEHLAIVKLAANEAVANVTEHGYDSQPNQPITCIATRMADHIRFDILHDGKQFVPPTKTPVVDWPLEGGMGLFLIEQCVDEVSYCQSTEGRQCIRLIKYFCEGAEDGNDN